LQAAPQSTFLFWVFYCSAIFVFFSTIKYINARLHALFDNGQCVEVLQPDPNPFAALGTSSSRKNNSDITAHEEAIEMQDLVRLKKSV
jgi:hypothetical protein